MSAAPHYGLRYGSAPATGSFQRLRGRPPLVSPLKSCMSRSLSKEIVGLSILRERKRNAPHWAATISCDFPEQQVRSVRCSTEPAKPQFPSDGPLHPVCQARENIDRAAQCHANCCRDEIAGRDDDSRQVTTLLQEVLINLLTFCNIEP